MKSSIHNLIQNKLFFILLLSYLVFEEVRSQICQQSPSSFDKISQSCINCHLTCESCFGPLKNQCTKCKVGFFYQELDNLCEEKCENIFYQDSQTMTCRKCNVPGCVKCNLNNICSECQQNLELSQNGQCYQKETCDRQQLYDFKIKKCVQTCENNQIENLESKICQNLSNCNIVNEFQSYQIKKGIEQVMILSNKNILLFEPSCRFYIADQNLQIVQFFELMPESQFLSKANIQQLFFSQDDIVGCSGINQVIIYDVVKEQYIKRIDLTFSTNVVISYIFYNIQAIFYLFSDGSNQTAALDLNTQKQVLILKSEQTNGVFAINIKKRMFILYSSTSKKAYLYQILSDGNFQQNILPINTFNKAYSLNDDQGIFACFIQTKLDIYQLYQGETFSVILLFSISSLVIFNNEILFFSPLKYIIISFMSQKYLNIYKVADDWKSYTLASKITSSSRLTLGGLAITNQSIDKQYMRIINTSQICFVPLDISSFQLSTQTVNNFECVVQSQLNLPLITKVFLIEKQILIFYELSTKALQLYTAEIGSQQFQTEIFKTTEGYTNYLEPMYYFSNKIPNQNLQQQNIINLIDRGYLNQHGKSKFVFFENYLPLSYYQNNQQFRNNWLTDNFFDEPNKIISSYAFIFILNSQNLFLIQYEDDKQQRKMAIYDMTSLKVIYKKDIPSSFSNNNLDQPLLIKKYKYILFQGYNILYNLNTNTLITSFATDINYQSYYYSLSIEDKIMIIDNHNMIVKYYDLIKNQYIQVFQDQNYYYIQFIDQASESGYIQLLNENYLYFLFDDDTIKAFSLITNKFITNVISAKDYHYDLIRCFFSGTLTNELFLFTATKVIQFSQDLQVTKTYQFPTQNTKIIQYYKYRDQYILSANSQAFFKFDLVKKMFTTLLTEIGQVNTLNSYILRFLGEKNELIQYINFIVNHQIMKLVQIFDSNIEFQDIYTCKTETDSFSYVIDGNTTQIMFIRNIEKYPLYLYDLENSQTRIIHKDNLKYILYYYDSISQKIINQDLLNPIGKVEYLFDHSFELMVVDKILNMYIFTDKGKDIYLFNPSDQIQQIKLISTYNTIEMLDICENQSIAIVQANSNQIYILQVNIQLNYYFILIFFNYEQYLQQKSYKVDLSQYLTLNSLKYIINCEQNIIIVYSPSLKEYLIDKGVENMNSIFPTTILNTYSCKPYYDIENKIVIYPAEQDNQFIVIKDKVSTNNFVNCKDGVTDLSFDYDLNLVFTIEGKQRNIKIVDGFTSNIKHSLTTINYFENRNIKIDTKRQQIIILDASPSLIIYNYLNAQQISNTLDYVKLQGFVVDIEKQFIFFYDSYFIYIHKFPTMEFKMSLYDTQNPNSIISEIILDQILNTLIVYKETHSVLLYDLNQLVYTEPLFQAQYLENQSLKFDSDFYLLYNIRNRALSLFQVNIFKDKIIIISTDLTQILIGKLIKINQNQFFYHNLDYMLLGQVDFTNSKIQKLCENFNYITIRDIYINQSSQTLIVIENISNNIYHLDLQKSIQYQSFNFVLKVNNNRRHRFFNGFIQKQSIVFYNENNIYSYNIESSNVIPKQIGQSNISLVVKLSPPNSEIDMINSNNNYVLDYLYSNEFDLQNSYVLVIINNDKKLKILDSQSLNELYVKQFDYLILNVYVERSRNLIFVIGSRGITHIFNYQLQEMAKLSNTCLLQTKIQSDNFYIYVFCEKQLDVYNRITLQKVYPTKIIQGSLNKVIYTQQNNIFILVSNKIIQVANLKSSSSTIKVLFEKEQNLLQILNHKISFDINNSRYLEIIAFSLIDIVYYRVALEQSPICSYTYQQSNSEMSNHFNQKTIQLNMIYSNQQLKELRIQYKQDQQLSPPPIYGNISLDGVKINIFSTKSNDNQNQSTIIWSDSSIFDDKQITSLQINSLNLNIGSSNSFILNQKFNMKQLQLYDINILSLNNPLSIYNYDKVILQSINLIQFSQQFNNDLISFINCKEIYIDDLVISDSQFITGFILKFVNSTVITIKNMKVVNSKLQSLLSFNQTQSVIVDNLQIMNISVQFNVIDQINTINTQLSNISLNQLKGGKFLKQLGCQQLSFDRFDIIKSQSFIIIEVIQYINIVVYQNLSTKIKNMNIQNSDDISFYISSDKIEFYDSNIINVVLGLKHFFTINSKCLSLDNVSFNEIKSQINIFILSVQNFESIQLKNTKFIENSVQLIQFINQSEGNIIRFEQVKLIQNTCQESLIQLQLSQQLEIIDSLFKKNSGNINGGVFSIQGMNLLKIQNTVFEENVTFKGKGGALYLYDVIQTFIENTQFINNESIYDNGGSIYYFCSDMIQPSAQFLINKNSIFKYNKASSGKGGALFLSKVNLLLESVKINQNQAAIGGGIFYENVIPDIILNKEQKNQNEISNNKATFFGQNFGSTLRQIQFLPKNQKENQYYFQSQIKPNVFEIINFQSGQYLQLSEINFLDEEQNLLDLKQVDNLSLNSLVQKELEGINLSIVNINQKQQIIFQGGLVQKYSQNGFNFNISLTYQPSSLNKFELQSNLMSELKYSDGSYYIKESQISLEFQVQFRSCEVGEIKNEILGSVICEKCPDGKYSINENDLQCTICPASAENCQGSQITLKEGYWRKNEQTDVIIPCSRQLISCQPQDLQSKFGCTEGYVGPLCEQCDFEGSVWDDRYSYSFSAKQFCSKCSNNIFYFAINIVIFFLFQFIQVTFAIYRITNQVERYLSIYYMKVIGFLYLSNSEKSSQNPMHQKILIDHLQIISIAGSFNLQLPTFFNYASDVVGNPLQISSIAFDCFYSLELNKTMPYWFFKFIWSILLPLLIIIFYNLYNKIRAFFKKTHNNSRYNATAIIYIYLFYFPSMITLISKSINCRNIGDESYSQIDLTISCREYDKHGKYIYYFIIPFAIVFAIILPFNLYLKIKKERQNKISRITQSRYKFLYEAFEENLYFWEILRLGFKSFIMITSILLFEFLTIKVDYSYQYFKACTISIILMAYYSLQTKFKPYRQLQINYLESQSTLICILTINLCLLYQEISQLNQIIGQLTSVVIYSTNIHFVVKLLLFIFLKPIPAEQEKRNIISNCLYKMQQKFPLSLPFITIQQKISMKSLLKIKIIKQNIKLLAQYRIQKNISDNSKFKKNLVKLIKNSTINGNQASLIKKLMTEQESEKLKSVKQINSEIQQTEFEQITLLRSKYLTKSPTNTRSNFLILLFYEKQNQIIIHQLEQPDFLFKAQEEKTLSPNSPLKLISQQFKTNSISCTLTTDFCKYYNIYIIIYSPINYKIELGEEDNVVESIIH